MKMTAEEREVLEAAVEALGDAKAYFDARDTAKSHEQLSEGPVASPLARRLDTSLEAVSELLGVAEDDQELGA